MDDDPSPSPAARSTLDVRVASAVGRLPLARARTADIARRVLRGEGCRSAALSVTFVSPRTIARLNRRYLGHRGATDVITFGHDAPAPGAPLVGDIYIAPDVAANNARAAGGGTRAELVRLTVHGVLHALGWTHPEGEGRERSPMWRRQERWITRLHRQGAW